jgi:hypothetical protein
VNPADGFVEVNQVCRDPFLVCFPDVRVGGVALDEECSVASLQYVVDGLYGSIDLPTPPLTPPVQ